MVKCEIKRGQKHQYTMLYMKRFKEDGKYIMYPLDHDPIFIINLLCNEEEY